MPSAQTGMRPLLVRGEVGLLMARRGRLFLVVRITMSGGLVRAIEAIADRDRLEELELSVVADRPTTHRRPLSRIGLS